ncbi:XrtA system polysaccharide deacetylase [Rhodospirillum rubrum]|uniref:XrtA system polysaccharide deacetylase n=1 Tax=Rhodospirillum rubrum TaxID=1085 RepID=UPI001F5B3C7F|nr:XrtA system polysaccharide deacetylase [Rhodospirillum rubrum]
MDVLVPPPAPSPAFEPVVAPPLRRDGRIVNAMSVDVEEHFQVQALAGRVSRDQWDGLESRVEANTGRILDLFARHGVTATFFTLGWIAERHPGLIRRIVAEGHELASHGWTHHLVTSQTPEQFRADVRRTKALLEDIGGVAVRGYRAATFSVCPSTLWALGILEEEGYAYSSSIFPVHHDLYGMPDAPRFAFHPLPGRAFIEYPMTTLRLAGRNLPCGGGGYFRLLPLALFRAALSRVQASENQPGIFYFHPWEIDPDQPRFDGLPLKSRFRHYVNLDRMAGKLDRLLGAFAWDRLDRVFGVAAQADPPAPPRASADRAVS